MRSHLGILMIVLAVSLGLVTVGVVKLEKTAEQVTVEEINSFGDKSAAEGIHLSLPVAGFGGQLIWDTEIILSEEAKSLSQVQFYQTEQKTFYILKARWKMNLSFLPEKKL